MELVLLPHSVSRNTILYVCDSNGRQVTCMYSKKCVYFCCKDMLGWVFCKRNLSEPVSLCSACCFAKIFSVFFSLLVMLTMHVWHWSYYQPVFHILMKPITDQLIRQYQCCCWKLAVAVRSACCLLEKILRSVDASRVVFFGEASERVKFLCRETVCE